MPEPLDLMYTITLCDIPKTAHVAVLGLDMEFVDNEKVFQDFLLFVLKLKEHGVHHVITSGSEMFLEQFETFLYALGFDLCDSEADIKGW